MSEISQYHIKEIDLVVYNICLKKLYDCHLGFVVYMEALLESYNIKGGFYVAEDLFIWNIL